MGAGWVLNLPGEGYDAREKRVNGWDEGGGGGGIACGMDAIPNSRSSPGHASVTEKRVEPIANNKRRFGWAGLSR